MSDNTNCWQRRGDSGALICTESHQTTVQDGCLPGARKAGNTQAPDFASPAGGLHWEDRWTCVQGDVNKNVHWSSVPNRKKKPENNINTQRQENG